MTTRPNKLAIIAGVIAAAAVLFFGGSLIQNERLGQSIPCASDTRKPVHERITNCDIPASERATLKGAEIARVVEKERISRQKNDIEIVNINAIDGGVEVFVRAWRDGGQIGFGKDGSVDVERFRIFNPPVLVPDENGDIVRELVIDEGEDTEQKIVRRFREDPKEALLQVVEHNLSVMMNVHGPENIQPGKRGNTTSTFYPDADPETDTWDGYVGGRDDSWDTLHDATTRLNGESSNDDGTGLTIGARYRTTSDNWRIRRSFTLFNTSSIPSGDTILSATVSIAPYTLQDDFNGTYSYIGLVQVQGDQIGSDTGFSDDDFDQVGDAIDNPTEGASSIRIEDMTVDTYSVYTLNATGLGWIAKSGEQKPSGATAGITYLGWRSGADIEDNNSDFTPSDKEAQRIGAYAADNSGTTYDPKLVVEHEAGGAAEEEIPRVRVGPVVCAPPKDFVRLI